MVERSQGTEHPPRHSKHNTVILSTAVTGAPTVSEADQRGDVENKQGCRAGSVPGRDPQLQAGQLSWGQRMKVLSHSYGVCWIAGLRTATEV